MNEPTQPNPTPVMTGTVTASDHKPSQPQELSSGAQAGIGISIGTCNICCSPFCYACPTIMSTLVGVILYVVWKDEKPKTAKNILMVSLITGGIGFLIFGCFFMLGMAVSLFDAFNY